MPEQIAWERGHPPAMDFNTRKKSRL